jgi:Big-like domain-containing protein/VCBS repeat protein/HYDIN/CFA65/VesB family protein/centrosomal CEP192-like protein
MRSLRFTAFFLALTSVLLLAQSAKQSERLPKPQVTRPPLPPDFSLVPQSPAFARGATAVGLADAYEPERSKLPSGLGFDPAVTYLSGGCYAYSLAAADLNGDGILDLVVTQGSPICGQGDPGAVGVLLGNGDGTFQKAVTYDAGPSWTFAVAVADVNGDGKPDLLVDNWCIDQNCDGGVSVLLGNGDGTFQPAVTYGTGGKVDQGPWQSSLAVADVNGDGKPDVLVANECADSNCDTGSVGVLLGNGDGTFQSATTYNTGAYDAFSVTVADINGDGKPDALVANNCSTADTCESGGPDGTVSVLLGNGDGTFGSATTYSSGGLYAESIAVADVNGDSRPDIIVGNIYACCNSDNDGSVGILLGNGDGTFQSATAYSSGGYVAFSVSVADVDGDGKPDLVVTNECTANRCANASTGGVGVLLGNGDGTFQTAATYGTGGWAALFVAVADVNGDGKPDLVVANECSTSNWIECYSGGAVGVLINAVATTTALTSLPNPSNLGQTVTFTATVTPQGQGTPTGTVSFFDSGTNIGNSNLNSSGIATLMSSSLAVGTHTITATYNGDSTFAPSTSSPLSQVVQGAIAILSPSGLNFGNQSLDIPSAPQNEVLQNTGNINLTISTIQITGANEQDFSQKNNCPASLPPNSSCKISVTFTPKAAGTRNAAVSVTDNAPGSPQSASLTGVGIVPGVMFSPTSLTFATQLVYTTSPPQKVTLTNTGAGILKVTSANVSGQFAIKTDCGEMLGPGASCTANVTFKPTTKGPLSGSISITDNAPDSPQSVPLSGTGTFVQLTPTSVNFGTQPVNTTSPPKYVTLENKGDTPLNFTGSGISLTGSDPGDFAQQNNCGSGLASGAYCRIKVTFTPSQQGKRTADISVSDDGGGSPQLVPLAGTGTP